MRSRDLHDHASGPGEPWRYRSRCQSAAGRTDPALNRNLKPRPVGGGGFTKLCYGELQKGLDERRVSFFPNKKQFLRYHLRFEY